MLFVRSYLAAVAFVSNVYCQGTGDKLMPAPNGTYNVALTTTSLVDASRQAPLAPAPTTRLIEISIFYPTTNSAIASIPYFPQEIALALDVEHSQYFNLSTPNGTFEQLLLPLAPPNTSIATPPYSGAWPVLLFNPAYETTRHLYSTLLSHLASTGYVVIAFDSPYDSDVFLLPNSSTIISGNQSDYAQTDDALTSDMQARAADFSFIIDNLSQLSTLIANCSTTTATCLNTTQIGALGHSIGGAASTTAAAQDPRIIGAANLNGAVWGDVITTGINVPYLLFTATGQTSSSQIVTTTPQLEAWNTIWDHIPAAKWWLTLADSLHYTFSDLPLILGVLGVKWDEATGKAEQITRADPWRSTSVLVQYVGAFFGVCFDGSGIGLEFLEGPSEEWPEVAFDRRTSVAGGTSGTAGPAPYNPESSASALRVLHEYPVVAKLMVGLVLCYFVCFEMS